MNQAFLMCLILLQPLVGALFTAVSRYGRSTRFSNALYVSILSVLTNLSLIVALFARVGHGEIVTYSLIWPIGAPLTLIFSADTLALLTIAAVHLALLTGMVGLKPKTLTAHRILVVNHLYLWALNGYFLASNTITLWLFFMAQVVIIALQCGLSARTVPMYRTLHFFMQNFAPALVFLACIVIGNALLSDGFPTEGFPCLTGDDPFEKLLGFALFAVMLLRLPLWPMTRAWQKMCQSVENPITLVNLFVWPATGIYGLLRFVPENLIDYTPLFGGIIGLICVVPMCRAATDCLKNPSLVERVIDVAIMNNMICLSAVCLPTDALHMNVGYALFAFLNVAALLAVSAFHLCQQQRLYPLVADRLFRLLPRTAGVYVGAVSAVISLPITSLFWNNFIILSELADLNLIIGGVVVVLMTLTSVGMLNTLYMMRDKKSSESIADYPEDLSDACLCVYISIFGILFLSLIKPLWFVF